MDPSNAQDAAETASLLQAIIGGHGESTERSASHAGLDLRVAGTEDHVQQQGSDNIGFAALDLQGGGELDAALDWHSLTPFADGSIDFLRDLSFTNFDASGSTNAQFQSFG